MELNELRNRLKESDKQFRVAFNNVPQEQMKNAINNFYSQLLEESKSSKDLHDELLLSYYELLNYYAQAYDSRQTLENLLNEYSKPEINQGLKVRYKVRFSLVASRTYLFRFQLLKAETADIEKSDRDFIKYLLEAKRQLSRMYSEHIAKRIELNDGQLIYCLENLAICYADLSRWYESLYYSNLGLKLDSENINLIAVRRAVLDRLRDATCQNYTGQLLFQIMKSIEKIKKFEQYPAKEKEKIKNFESEIIDEIQKYKLKLNDLENEASLAEFERDKCTDYINFIDDNDLFLNEHSNYCKCKHGKKDNLKIKSSHKHTHTAFVHSFEVVLESIKFDFIQARFQYYSSLDATELKGFHLKSLSPGMDYRKRIKETFLKESFKLCLSIFDTVAIAILEALKLNSTSKNSSNSKIYFTNIFENYIDPSAHKRNFYLNTLYSISEDLKSEKSGHRDLKDIRNDMEHGIFLFQGHGDQNFPFNKKNFRIESKSEIEEKTKVLLVLTKSLIISFTYFIRRESKSPENAVVK